MTTQQRITVRTLSDVIYAVPRLLGFEPKDSLVIVGLDGPRQRMSFTMRIDLTDVGTEMLTGLADKMRASGAEAVLVYVYDDSTTPTARPLPHQELVSDMGLILLGAGIDTRDAVLVANGRFWSYLCAEETCCPIEGKPLEPNTEMEAAFVTSGLNVQASREALVASVTRPGEATAIDALLDDATPLSPADTVTLLVSTITPDGARITDADAATLIRSLHDIAVRDLVLAIGCDNELAEHVLPLVLDLVQRVSRDDAPLCAVAATLSYLHGDGVVTRTLLDRADDTDPTYGMTSLLRAALDAAIHPSEIKRALVAGRE